MSWDPDGSSWPLHGERMTNTMSSVGSAKGKNCLFGDYSVLPSAPVSPWRPQGSNLDYLSADYSVLPSAPVSPWRPQGSNLDYLSADYSVLPSPPTISRRCPESKPSEDDFVTDQTGLSFQCQMAFPVIDAPAPKFPWRPQGSCTFKDDSERELIESLYVRPSKPPSFPSGLRLPESIPSENGSAPAFPWRPQGSYRFKDDPERELIESLYVRPSKLRPPHLFPSGLRLPESIPSDNDSVTDQILNLPTFPCGEELVGPKSMLKKNPAQLLENGEKRRKLMGATECFYLGEWRSEDYRDLCYGGPCEWPKECNHACAAAKFALSSYSRTEGKELKFKELVRVNAKIYRSILFFLTMKASDELFYEAEVLWECDTNNMELYFVRVARHHPIRPELQCLIGPNAAEFSRV